MIHISRTYGLRRDVIESSVDSLDTGTFNWNIINTNEMKKIF